MMLLLSLETIADFNRVLYTFYQLIKAEVEIEESVSSKKEWYDYFMLDYQELKSIFSAWSQQENYLTFQKELRFFSRKLLEIEDLLFKLHAQINHEIS